MASNAFGATTDFGGWTVANLCTGSSELAHEDELAEAFVQSCRDLGDKFLCFVGVGHAQSVRLVIQKLLVLLLEVGAGFFTAFSL